MPRTSWYFAEGATTAFELFFLLGNPSTSTAHVQVDYLRQHVAPVTPREVAGPIDDYIAANIDLVALDGQHQSAAIANAAADRGAAAAAKIRAACGIS